ncbi:hypothetical protein BD410DRAFT_650192 [Rickenella mellea]|uniref:Uncharacterized protein n=1 Tax=Rickenella mellea TaxID=50990 RepID=A0A4Y7PKV7_9AGAM|nr:hypothetical protein BD410DRAFT_650192 [Rickenella mellea]
MRNVGLGNGLGYFILRDGALYFLAKLLIGVVNITAFFVLPPSVAIGNWIIVIVGMSNALTVILINRLVLNLRQVSHLQEGIGATLGTIGTIPEPAFATNTFLGNIGGPLRIGSEDDLDDDGMEEVGSDDEAEVVEQREIMNHTQIIEEPHNPSDV